ncbi:MAG: hypothetical protein RRC07_08420 [Anaerolineae bacterium]|nr:hypothetical protein [Anaerolineae bacterium]
MAKKTESGQQAATKPKKQQVIANFVACDRCSFFLAGYKILFGDGQIEDAITASDGHWLLLHWDPQTRHLLQKSYGGRLDMEFDYYDSQCPACQRRFVYEDDEKGEQLGGREQHFRIEIKPPVP